MAGKLMIFTLNGDKPNTGLKNSNFMNTRDMFIKRIFDFFISLTGLIFSSPLLIIIALIIKLFDGSPMVFTQIRVGRNFKRFNIYKFRTMMKNAKEGGSYITTCEDPRITKIGKFLRKYKLDEIPQLINVIKGDMSIVGPRPEVPKYVEIFKDDYKDILLIKPGITDPASIKFRNENDLLGKNVDPEAYYLSGILPEKIKYYKQYAGGNGFLFDLMIIIKTIFSIIK